MSKAPVLQHGSVKAECQRCGWSTMVSPLAWIKGYDCEGCGNMGLKFADRGEA